MNDFGGKLRLAREQRGLSLRQIAATTKISIAALEALERNDVSKLPGGIFSRSFVRSYAIEVGLDPDQTVHEFLERFQGLPSIPIPAPATASADEAAFGSRQRIAGIVLRVVLITIPLIVLILYFTMRTRIPSSASVVPPATIHADAAAPTSTPAETPAPVATAGAADPKLAPRSLMLDIHPTGDCWIKLTVDGKVIASRIMHAGDKETEEVHDKAVIQIGDAGAFAYSVNGRPGKALGPSGSVRTATISKDTLASYVQ